MEMLQAFSGLALVVVGEIAIWAGSSDGGGAEPRGPGVVLEWAKWPALAVIAIGWLATLTSRVDFVAPLAAAIRAIAAYAATPAARVLWPLSFILLLVGVIASPRRGSFRTVLILFLLAQAAVYAWLDGSLATFF